MAYTSPRKQALSNLADKIPTTNAQLARQKQQAQQISLRQQMASASPDALNVNVASAAGGQAQQLAQGAAAEARQQSIQQQGQIGQAALQETMLANQAQQFDKEQLIEKAQIHLANKLNQIDQQAKQKVFDERLAFSAAEANRGYMQQRQLADFAILSSRSRQNYLDNAQKVEQWHKKELQVMEMLHKSLMQDLKNHSALREQGLDHQARLEAERLISAYNKKIEKKKNKAANNRSMWAAGGTIVGAVAGGVVGGPVGAAMGASVGGAAGTAVGGAVEGQ